MPTTYRITAPHFCAAVIRQGDIVIQSAPILQWTVGRDWEFVRTYFNRKGYTIEPLLDPPPLECARIGAYFVHYRGQTIHSVQQLSSHGTPEEEVSWNDLPSHVQDYISNELLGGDDE